MSPSGIVTLLTDFGHRDPFVGVMKGAILNRFRGATIVDLTHEVPPQDVRAGAFWLARSWQWFPAGTVHVVVVDPGVGTDRPIVVVRAQGHYFVAPDNGVALPAVSPGGDCDARRVDLDRFGIRAASATFHGRDIFAPVAAAVAAQEVRFDDVGPPVSLQGANPIPVAQASSEGWRGEVVVVDRFGNLLTNLTPEHLASISSPVVEIGGRELSLQRCYADVASGQVTALVNSQGVLEVAQRNGSAAESLSIGPGALVRLSSSGGPR